MEGSVLSFLKAEWKVSNTGSAHWASSFSVRFGSTFCDKGAKMSLCCIRMVPWVLVFFNCLFWMMWTNFHSLLLMFVLLHTNRVCLCNAVFLRFSCFSLLWYCASYNCKSCMKSYWSLKQYKTTSIKGNPSYRARFQIYWDSKMLLYCLSPEGPPLWKGNFSFADGVAL